MKIINIYILLAITLMFTGCLAEYSKTDINAKKRDLEAYQRKIRKQTNERINLEREEYVYKSDDLVDPFQSIFMKKSGIGNLKTLDISSPKSMGTVTELQRFDLEDFKLVGLVYGTILNDRRGLLLDSTGKTHIVREGNVIGKNYGRVSSIKKDRIEIKEITYDAHGGQKARKIKINLEE